MNAHHWLQQAQADLQAAGITTGRLDCLVLLEDCLQTDRAQILAHPELELTAAQKKLLDSRIKRRVTHEPLAYIRGKSEFYGRDFIIDHRVLEPRPESETIIDMLRALKLPKTCLIADIGTGSGMLAITAQLEVPHASVVAIDIDPDCLTVARANTEQFKLAIQCFQGDLLAPLKEHGLSPQVLLCNLPYVPDDFHINTAAGREPKRAIFGGPDGLEHYRTLFSQLDSFGLTPGYIFTESLPPQHSAIAEIAKPHGYKQAAEDDFIQLFTPAKRAKG